MGSGTVPYGTDYTCEHGEPIIDGKYDCARCTDAEYLRDLAQQQDEKQERRIIATSLLTMTPKAPKWFWHKRIPVGSITLLGGRPSIGKSTISLDIAARFTRGGLAGEYLGHPHSVGIVAAEDDYEAVILPRLMMANADISRVYRLDVRTEELTWEIVSLPMDINRLGTLCEELDLRFILIDPLMSSIHDSIDTYNDRKLRVALDPLKRFAETHGVAVMGLVHPNKGEKEDPVRALSGAQAFGAAPRSILYCITDPEAEKRDRYLFGHIKSNLGPLQATMGYHLIACVIPSLNGGGDIETSRVVWDNDDDRTIADVMTGARNNTKTELTQQVIAFLGDKVDGSASLAELGEQFPHIEPVRLRQQLSRMVDRGEITRPARGRYGIPKDI